MMEIPTRRAFHIFVRLAGNPIYYQDDVYRLQGALPSCTRPVIVDNSVIVLATMTEENESELLERCKAALNHFHVVTVVELGRLSASTDGLFGPFHDWMNNHVRQGPRGEGYNPEDVLKAKWGKIVRKDTDYGSVRDAIRKVFPGTMWPRSKRV
jgi:hypothetical protein